MTVIKKKKGKAVPVLLLLFITLVSSTVVCASSTPAKSLTGVQPFWQNVVSLTITFNVNSGRAELSASVSGNPGVSKITASAVLEQQDANGTYSQVERWDNISADGQWLGWSATRYVEKGYTYRFTYTATAYKNGVGETVSGSKTAYY